MQYTLTAAEIRDLARSAHFISFFTFSDGAQSWSLEALTDALTDEAILGEGPDSTITLVPDGLTAKGREEFLSGFLDRACAEYDVDADLMASTPYCAPWTWAPREDWFGHNCDHPYNMGLNWADKCESDIIADFTN